MAEGDGTEGDRPLRAWNNQVNSALNGIARGRQVGVVELFMAPATEIERLAVALRLPIERMRNETRGSLVLLISRELDRWRATPYRTQELEPAHGLVDAMVDRLLARLRPRRPR